jgi:fibronectin-binding autotransporter adhesin
MSNQGNTKSSKLRSKKSTVALVLATAASAACQVGTEQTASAAAYFSWDATRTTWDTGVTADWGGSSGGPYTSTWSNYNNAHFEGTAGTVTVSSVYANTIDFDVNGYVLSGGTINIGNPGNQYIKVNGASNTATISSAISSPYNTTYINGTGSLILNGTGSSFNGLQVNGGSLTVSGGSLTDTSDFHISNGGVGAFTLSAGSVQVNGTFYMGNGGQNATFTQTGGTMTTGAWYLSNNGGVSILNISGGTLTSTSTDNHLGVRGNTTMTLSGAGVVNLPGLIYAHPSTSGGTTTVNLGDGATFSNGTSGILVIGTGGITRANGTANFNFNGGTLRASANNASFMSGLNAANILAGGAIIDTNGYNITIGQALLDGGGGGGLTVVGTGSLTLTGSDGYTGATTVSGGRLLLSGTGQINGTSGIAINGAGASFVQTSTVPSTPTITITQGTLDGTTTVGNVNVANSVNAILTAGNGGAGTLTMGTLTFNGAATVNLPTSSILQVNTLLTNGVGSTITLNPTGNHGTRKAIGYTTYNATNFSDLVGGTAQLTANQKVLVTNNTSSSEIDLTVVGDTAGVINWGAATTIAGDTDVFNVGASSYAYSFASTQTVNGVTFTGSGSTGTVTGSAGGSITLSSGLTSNTSAFNSASNPFNSLSAAYKAMLIGADYNGGGAQTVTLNNLASGHVYATQFWANDPRPSAGRSLTLTSTGGNSVTVIYSAANVAGSPGQYSIGGFTANGTSQAFTMNSSASTQINAIQLRDVTGVWSGATNSTWDTASNSTNLNWTGGNNYNTVAVTDGVTALYFADTDGFLNPVTNSTITVPAGGISTGSINFQNNTVNYTFSSADANGISGSTAMNKTGTGTVTLSGPNTYSGVTTVAAGTLLINNSSALGTNLIQITGNSTIDNTSGGTVTLANIFNLGSGVNLTFSGTNPLVLANGINGYTGGSTVTVTVNGTAPLSIGAILNNSAVTNTPGTSNGGGAQVFTKAGTGTLVITGTSIFGGGKTINLSAGTLDVNNNNALNSFGGNGANTLNISANTVLDNTSGSLVTVPNGSSGLGTMNWNGDFTFGGSSALAIQAAAVINANRQITVNGSAPVTLSGGITGSGLNLTFAGPGNLTESGTIATTSGSLTMNGSGTLTISGNNTYTGTTTVSGGLLILSSPSFNTYAGGQLNINNGSTLQITTTGGSNRYDFPARTFNFDANGGGTISSGTNASLNWVGQGTWTFATNGGARDNISGSAGMNLNGQSVIFNVARGSDQTSDLTVAIGMGNSSGSLTKTGNGILTLSGGNGYSGGTTISAGTLLANGTGALSGAAFVGASGTLVLSSSGTANWGNTLTGTGWAKFVFTGSGNSTVPNVTGFAGTIELADPNLDGNKWAINSTNVSSATLVIDNNNQLYVNGGSGTLTFGAIKLTGTGNNESRGAIRMEGNLAGPLTLLGNATIVNAGFTLNGTITNGMTNTAGTLTLNTSTQSGNGTFSGAISDGAGASTTALVVAAGTANLTATNTYSGATTISSGATLQVSSAGSLGSGSYAGNISNAGTLQYSSSAAQTLSGVISGGGALLKDTSTSALTLSGSNTYTGVTTINAGTLSAGVASGAGYGAFGNNSAVTLANAANTVLNITGFNTSIGSLAGGGTTGGNVTLGAATLTVGGKNTSTTYDGTISSAGNGGLTKTGTGILALTNTSTYSGATTINGGTLRAGFAASLAYRLDPSNPANYTLNGSNVNNFKDLGPNGNNFTNGGTGGPTVLTGGNGINGLSVLHFNGAQQLTMGNPTTEQTVFIIDRVTHYNANIDGIWGQVGDFGIREASSSSWYYNSGANGGDYANPSNGGNMFINGIQVASGTNGAYTLNQTQILEATNSSVGAWASTGLGEYGTGGAAGRFYTGDVGEVLAFSTVLTTAQRQQVEAYLNYKWFGTGAGVGNLLPTTTAMTISNGGTLDVSGENFQTIGSLSSTDGLGSKVTMGSANLTVGNASSTTFDGVISGTGALTKVGTGTMTLTGASIYTGVTNINGGVVNVGSAETAGTSGPLGNSAAANAGSIAFGGGTLQFSATNHNDYSGRFSTAASQAFNIDTNGQNVTFATALTSSGGTLNKLGTGTLTLSANNTYSGLTTISNGVLSVPSILTSNIAAQPLGQNGSLTLGGVGTTGTLLYITGGAATLNKAITVTNGGAGMILNSGTGLLTLGNTITKTGATLTLNAGTNGINASGQITGNSGSFNSDLDVTNGTVTLANTTNNYVGPTVIFGNGTLVNGSGADNALPSSTVLTLGTAGETGATTNTYDLGGHNQTVAGLATIASANNFVTSGAAGTIALTVNNDSSNANAANNTFGGVIQNGSGVVGLIKSGNLTLTLGGINTYTGGTTINGGELEMSGSGTLGATSGALSINTGGHLDLNSTNQTVASLNGTGGSIYNDHAVGTTATLTVGGGSYAGALIDSNNGSGQLALTLSGSGILTLTNSSSYTGATSIGAGKLVLDHSGANTGGLGNSAVSVGASGTLLAKGNSTIGSGAGGTLNIASTGLLSLQDSSVNALTIGGNLTLNSSILNLELGSTSSSNDAINLGAAGLVSLTGTTTINLSLVSSLASGSTSYTLISAPGGGLIAGGGGFTLGNKPAGFNSFSLSTSTTTAEILTVTATATPAIAYWTGLASATGSPTDPGNNWGYGALLVPTQSNWSTNQAGTTDAGQVPGAATDVFFTAANASSTAGVLTTQLDAMYNIKSLTFDTSPQVTTPISSVILNINGNTLNVGTGGLKVAGTDNSNTTINGAGSVLIAASESWANNNATKSLTVNAGIGGTAGSSTTQTLTLNGTGVGGITLGGVVSDGANSGTLALLFNQAGITTLSGSNTFTGGVTIHSGTVALGNTGAFNSTAPNALTFDASSTGKLQLAGNSVAVGSLNTNATVGTPIIENGLTATTATLTDNTTGADTYAGVLQNGAAGTLSLTMAGSGTLILTGANSYGGTTTINGGKLQVGAGGAAGTLGTGPVVDNGATLTFFRNDNSFNITSNISGNGTMIFNGTGTSAQSSYQLSGSNSFSGNINVNNGARLIPGTGATNTNAFPNASMITVASGGGIYVAGGTYNTPLTITGTGWQEGAGLLGALRIDGGTWAGSITLSGNATIEAYNGTGTVSGNVAIGSNTLTLNVPNIGNVNMNGNLISTTSGAVNKTGGFSVFLGGDNSGLLGTYTNSASNTFFNSATSSSAATAWVVNSGNLANTLTGSRTLNLGSLAGSGGAVGNNVGSSAITYSIGALNTNTTYSGTIVDSVGGGGTSALTKVGTGTLTLAGHNTYSGNTAVSGGTLQVVAGGIISAPAAIEVYGASGATLTIAGGSVTTTSSSGDYNGNSLEVGKNSGQPGFLNISGGTLNVSGGNFTIGDSGNGTFNQTGGTVNYSGGGDFWVGNNAGVALVNLSAGTFTQTGGTFRVGIRATSTVTLSGSALVTVPSVTFGHPSTSGATDAFNLNGGTLVTGSIGTASGTPTFNFNGGTLTASGNSTTFFTGLSAATVQDSGGVINNNGFAITIGQGMSHGGVASTDGGLTFNGASTTTLTGANSYNGTTTINAGKLQVGNGGTSGTLGTGPIINNTNLTLNRSNALGVPGAISGSGSLTQAGAGVSTLSGSSTYTGATNITGGTLRADAGYAGNLVYQVDASNAANYTLSGSNVSQLNDLTGNGKNFTNGGGTGPTVLTGGSGINGMNVLHFNGAQQLTMGSSTTEQTVFIVDRVTHYNGNIDGIWGQVGDFGIREASSSSWYYNNGANSGDYANPSNGGAMYINGVAVALGQNGSYTLNQAQILEATNSSVGAWGSTGLGEYGTGGAANRYYTGDVGEVLAFSGVLTTAQRQQVEAYLNKKWFGTGAGIGNLLSTTSATTISGGGTLDVSGENYQTISSLSSTDGLGSKVTLGSATLTVGDVNNTAFDGVISGSGGVIKQGSGNLTVSGNSTYAGGTTVTAGKLTVANTTGTSATGLGTVTINSTGTLAGSQTAAQGFIGGPVTVNSGGTIATYSNAGVSANSLTLTVGTLATPQTVTLNAGSNLTFNLTSTPNGNSNPLMTINGNLNLAGSGVTITVPGTSSNVGQGTYDLIGYTGTLTNFGNFGTISGPSPYLYTLFNNTAQHQLDLNVTGTLVWTGKIGGTGGVGVNNDSNWNTSSTNWAGGTTYPAPAVSYADGGVLDVQFTDTNLVTNGGITNSTVTIQGSGVTPKSITFNNSTAVTYLIQNGGANGIMGASTSVTKNGNGTAIFNGSNSYGGGTTINNGILQIGSSGNGALGSGNTMVAGNGELLLNGVSYTNSTGTVTIAGTGTDAALYGTGTSSFASAINVNNNASIGAGAGSTLNLNGGVVVSSAAVTFTGGGTININNAGISNGASNDTGVFITGLGTNVVFNAGNTFGGSVVQITGNGTLTLGASSVMPIFNAPTVTVGSGNPGDNSSTFNLNGQSDSVGGLTLTGGTVNGGGDLSSGAITVNNGGNLIAAGTTVAGPTAILNDASTLTLNGILSGGASLGTNADTNFSTGATLNGTGQVSNIIVYYNNTISSTGTLTVTTPGGFQVIGTGNVISAGTLKLGSGIGVASQTSGSDLTVNGTLKGGDTLAAGQATIDTGNPLPIYTSLQGTGIITGPVTLNGTTLVSGGTVSGGTLSSVDGFNPGNGTLTPGTLTVQGNLTVTSGTVDNNIYGGTVAVGGTTSVLGNSALNVNSGATLASTVTVSSNATLSGAGTIAGTVTLNAAAQIAPHDAANATAPAMLAVSSLNLSHGTSFSPSKLDMNLGAPTGTGNSISTTSDLLNVTTLALGTGYVTLNPNPITGFGPGTYELIKYGSDTGSLAHWASSDPNYRYIFTDNTSQKEIDVTVASVNDTSQILIVSPDTNDGAGATTKTIAFGNVLLNGVKSVSQSLHNTSGVDAAGYTITLGGAGGIGYTSMPLSGSIVTNGTLTGNIGVKATSAGAVTGTITIQNTAGTSGGTGMGSADGNDVFTVTATAGGNATAANTDALGVPTPYQLAHNRNGDNSVPLFIAANALTADVSPTVSYDGLASTVIGTANNDSNFKGTTATILKGNADVAKTVSMNWRNRSVSEATPNYPGGPMVNPKEVLISDVVLITGMGLNNNNTGDHVQTDMFALQMTYNSADLPANELTVAASGKLYLGWLDTIPTDATYNQWINAVGGNFGGMSVANGFEGAVAFNPGNNFVLGEWGVDTLSHTVWAVLNHNSEFAVVVPEPTSLGLLGLGALGLLGRQRRKNRA